MLSSSSRRGSMNLTAVEHGCDGVRLQRHHVARQVLAQSLQCVGRSRFATGGIRNNRSNCQWRLAVQQSAADALRGWPVSRLRAHRCHSPRIGQWYETSATASLASQGSRGWQPKGHSCWPSAMDCPPNGDHALALAPPSVILRTDDVTGERTAI